ncbi:MAG: hypothetical protein M1838_005685 [Thelocarpon superellum]|nr:MAG: hypothetical protein M1838_005685 [Thelocarpon superellum]
MTTAAPIMPSEVPHLAEKGSTNGLANGTMSKEIPEPYNDWPNDAGFDGDEDFPIPVELTVAGHIPDYTAGTLYRTGPGSYQADREDGSTYSLSHWFDGFSKVHRFQIVPPDETHAHTRVLYNSRSNVDRLLEEIRTNGTFTQVSFGQKRDPCRSYFRKVMSLFTPAFKGDNNVGVTLSINPPGLPATKKKEGEGHSSGLPSLWAKTDAAVYKQLDPETLEPVGIARQTSLHPDLKGVMSAAHAKSDPDTGDVFNYNLEFGRKPTYRIFRANAATGTTDILATITDAPGAYLHSLFLTANYVVLCVWNSHYAKGGMQILWEQNMLDAIMPFDASKPTKWYVIDRTATNKGVVATYESESFFSFHTINAWEEKSNSTSKDGESGIDLVADISAYDNVSVLKHFYYENLKSTAPGALQYTGDKGESARVTLRRYRLAHIPSSSPATKPTMGKATLDWRAPASHSAELPTFNPLVACRSATRYIYGIADRGRSTFTDGLVKFDTVTQQARYWECQGHSPGEPIFVPTPRDAASTETSNGTANREGEDQAEEDAGVLLSVVLNGHTSTSYLLVLDARSMTELGRATLDDGRIVSFGFHGVFLPSASSSPSTAGAVLDV